MSLSFNILSGALLLTTVALSAKQGYGMLTDQPEPAGLLRQLGVGRPGRALLGGAVALGAGLTLVPATFVGGSVLSAACILSILGLQLHQRNLAGAAAEVPFLLLALGVLYLGHPLDSAGQAA